MVTLADFMQQVANCCISNPGEVSIKVVIHDPLTGNRRLHDVKLVRSAGPGWNDIEIVPVES